MFTHVMVGSDDIDTARKFYDATLGALGIPEGFIAPNGRLTYATPTGLFVVTKPLNEQPASFANGGTIGFAASSTDQVNAWHAGGVANGGTTCEDPPGIRNGSIGKLYLAYLRDPAGNKVCALHRVNA